MPLGLLAALLFNILLRDVRIGSHNVYDLQEQGHPSPVAFQLWAAMGNVLVGQANA